MRAIDKLLSSVDMTAQAKQVELEDGETFEFYVKPLTAAERERAMKEAGSGADQASKFSMHLILTKCLDENGQKLFAAGDAAQLKNRMPSKLFDALLTAVLGNDEPEEEEADATPKRTSKKA